MSPEVTTARLWIAWIVSWWLAAFWRDRAVTRPSVGSELGYRLVVLAGALLLYFSLVPGAPRLALWNPGAVAKWMMVALVAAGLLFTWWARIHLGRLWSGSVTRKAEHRIVDSGPYGLVRHPIYTGVIIAQMATAVENGSAQALLGAAMMFVGWYMKARIEESFLRTQMAPGSYDAYARRVPMLVPFTARSR